MPHVDAEIMNLYLEAFAQTIDDDAHIVMVLDGAGWHKPEALNVPDNITLVIQPPYSPELNPVERLWLYLRETSLSLRVFNDKDHIIDACCEAWNRATHDFTAVTSICLYPYIKQVLS